MAIRKRPAKPVEEDLEATAELPLMDFAGATDVELPVLPEAAAATDVYPIPAVPAGAADLADSLREVEQRLQRKSDRVQALEGELAAATARGAVLEGDLATARRELAEREAVLHAQLEAQEAAFAARLAQRETQLQKEHAEREGALQKQLASQADESQREQATSGSRQSELKAQLDRVRDELAAARLQVTQQRTALEQSQRAAEQSGVAHGHQERELLELRRRSAQQYEALCGWHGFRAVSESMLFEAEDAQRAAEARHAAALGELQARCAQLEADAGASRERGVSLDAQLAQDLKAHAERESAWQAQLAAREAEWQQQLAASQEALRLSTEALAARDEELKAVGEELAELREIEEAAREGVAMHAAQRNRIESLEADFTSTQQRLRESEEMARGSIERVRRLESEVHASAALLGNLQQNIERLGREDTGSRPAMAPVAENVRVLVRQDAGSSVVYPLGRRTTVGRTPDNDIQIDTVHVSRHHAVLLSNSDHCIVEDLNSTNGVLVNGRRVGRHILHDGDAVTIGRTEFRYQQRP
jgi:DNA repair exonuclease SbcCD ATPase subunit